MTDLTHTILIADDEPKSRKLLELLLRSEGYRTIAVGTGEEAIASVAVKRPDLILLDVVMPGMDGHQVAKILKADAATSNIPIIMVTAQNRPRRALGRARHWSRGVLVQTRQPGRTVVTGAKPVAPEGSQ